MLGFSVREPVSLIALNLLCKSRARFWAGLPAVMALPGELCLQESRAGPRDRGDCTLNVSSIIVIWGHTSAEMNRNYDDLHKLNSVSLAFVTSFPARMGFRCATSVLWWPVGTWCSSHSKQAPSLLDFALLGCFKGIVKLLYSILLSGWVNGGLCSLFCLHKKTQKRLSLSDTLRSAFLFLLAIYSRSSHISGCLSITGLCCQDIDLAVCVKMLVIISFLPVT